jgi:protein-S-isoprenylcysteine O-methyltransferase Ste14
MNPQYVAMVVWFAWALSWFIAALWYARVAERVDFISQLPYRVITIMGGVMIFGIYTHSYRGPLRLWVLGDDASWAMVGLVAAGFLFTWWARIHLGALWSGTITRKEGHHVVDTGPYAFVRHPIYTGILLAAFATAAQRGTAVAIAGAFVMTLGFWIKARLEEKFLRTELGAEAYDSYRRRVPMLVPFGPKSA